MTINPDLASHLNPPPSRWRRLATAYTAGPLRDTAMVTYGALLVGFGYMLHAWTTT